MNCLVCYDVANGTMTYSGKQYPICISCFKKYGDMVGFGSSVESILELARFSELRSKGIKVRGKNK